MSPESPLTRLCLHCGLCCDGTLFTHVALTPAEATALREAGLTLMEREDGAPALRQPCAALNGKHCTAYAQRPGGCRRYQCQLFTALAEGEVSPEEALGAVDEVHAALAALEATLPPEPEQPRPTSVLQRARRSAQEGQLSSEAHEAWRHAEALLDRHLRGRTHRAG